MAQVVRYGEVDLESLLSQSKEMELVQKDGPGKKMPGAFVPAGQLNYANPEGWEITPFRAELIGSYVLHVDGKYPTKKLKKLRYVVSFVVELKDNLNIVTPVKLTLTPPGETNEYWLMGFPRNKPIALKAGEFDNNFESGEDIKFTLDGSESKTWKEGLVIYGVSIVPVPK